MVVEEDILEYLEHHGVKGMRWGVRGGASRSSSGGKARKPSTGERVKTALKSDTAKKVAIVGGVVGIAVAHQVLKAHGRTKMKQARIAAYSRNNQFNMYNSIQDMSRGKGGAFKESFGDLKKMQKSQGWDDSKMTDYLSRRFFAVAKMPKG